VTVNDIMIEGNNPPSDIALSNNQINENESIGTLIGVLTANDPDFGDSHIFSLIGANASLFSIQNESLMTAASFNFEQQSIYSITIQAEDALGNTFSKDFDIQVLDINEAPTDIFLSNNTVNLEGTEIEVGILSTIDEDIGDNHVYTLLPGNDASFFQIVDDKLLTDISLESDAGAQYTISVQSEDSQGLIIIRDFIITVVRNTITEYNFPNAFTPNGDGENDTWEIPYLNNLEYCRVIIMDRDGNVLFESIGYDNAWDGTYNGNKLAKGTYFYVIQVSRQGEIKNHKGFVVIL